MDFSTLTLEKLRKDSKSIKTPQDARGKSYLHSYQSILHYFEALRKNPITVNQFIVACHIVYGWMPKVLTIHKARIDLAVAAFNKAQVGKELEISDLEVLKQTVNNSMVGVSKLLHFLFPERYAIWDRKVCAYILGKNGNHIVHNVENYHDYLKSIRNLVKESGYKHIHDKIQDMLGYEVTKLRTIELLMFYSWKDSGK